MPGPRERSVRSASRAAFGLRSGVAAGRDSSCGVMRNAIGRARHAGIVPPLGARDETGLLLRALMAEAQRDAAFAASFRDGFLAQRRAVLRTLLEHAVERGEIAAVADLDLLVEVVYGTLWYRLLADSGPLDARFADALTELLLDRLPVAALTAREGLAPERAVAAVGHRQPAGDAGASQRPRQSDRRGEAAAHAGSSADRLRHAQPRRRQSWGDRHGRCGTGERTNVAFSRCSLTEGGTRRLDGRPRRPGWCARRHRAWR